MLSLRRTEGGLAHVAGHYVQSEGQNNVDKGGGGHPQHVGVGHKKRKQEQAGQSRQGERPAVCCDEVQNSFHAVRLLTICCWLPCPEDRWA